MEYRWALFCDAQREHGKRGVGVGCHGNGAGLCPAAGQQPDVLASGTAQTCYRLAQLDDCISIANSRMYASPLYIRQRQA